MEPNSSRMKTCTQKASSGSITDVPSVTCTHAPAPQGHHTVAIHAAWLLFRDSYMLMQDIGT